MLSCWHEDSCPSRYVAPPAWNMNARLGKSTELGWRVCDAHATLEDVNISHKSLPSLPAQRQICTHLDKAWRFGRAVLIYGIYRLQLCTCSQARRKVHNWFDRSRSAAKDLMESAGAKKPSTANSPMQAALGVV